MSRYSCGNITLMVQFKCSRCGKTHIEPAELQVKRTEGNIQCYSPPETWTNESLGCPMLCDECTAKYKAFLSGADVVLDTGGENVIDGRNDI